MYELNFNIEKVLNELEGMSEEQQCDALDKIYDDMEAACDTVLEAQYALFDKYEERVKAKVLQSVKEHIEKNGLQDSVVATRDMVASYPDEEEVEVFKMGFEDIEIEIHPVFSDWDELYVRIKLVGSYETEEEELEIISRLSEITGATYNEEYMDYLFLKVEEAEFASKMIETIEKILRTKS